MDYSRRSFLWKWAGTAVSAAISPLLTRPSFGYQEVVEDEETYWRLVRAQYPLTKERTYLNTGGLGPAPYPVIDAMKRTIDDLQSLSETGHRYIEEAREPVAQFFGVKPAEICFTRNATEANAIVAGGLELIPGDEVIFESHAHPGGSLPWLNRQKQDGIRVKVFEPDPVRATGNLERIESLITPRTRVIQVSHVTAPTGLRFPVENITRLAHDRGLWFHIDGAQSAGMFPINLSDIGCDSYGTSGHKWLGAPHGTGILFVREERLDEVRPVEVGAYSDAMYALPDVFEYHPTARRYEYGTRDAAKVVGIVAALHFLDQIGVDRVATYGHDLARYLQENLRQIEDVTVLTPSDPSLYGSMTTFKTNRVRYHDLYRFLYNEYQLRCRVVTEQGLDALRVSTHVFNSRTDCDRVVEATRAAIAKG